MFSNRYDELVGTMQRLAFDKINVRVPGYLKRGASGGGNTINLSHQSLARELCTTSVVISRILKQFENEKR